MKRLALRSILALGMLTCLLSSTQAGIIPWVYDTIFGPVRYPAYYGTAYGPSMGYGYSPYGQCSPCAPAVSYRQASPCATGRCSTGGCSTVSYYPTWPIGYAVVSAPCSTPCSTKKTWRASDSVDRLAPEPRDEGLTTFADEGKDPFGADKPPRPVSENTPVRPDASGTETTGAKTTAATGEGGSVTEQIKKDGWKETSKSEKPETESTPGETGSEAAKPAAATTADEAEKPAGTAVEETKAPLLGDDVTKDKPGFEGATREGEATEAPEGADPKAGETKALEVKPLPEVQEKATWKISSPVRRIAFRASFSNVRIARVSPSVEGDYVIPAASLTRIAGR